MAVFERHVDVNWTGSVTEGNGVATAGTGAFAMPVTFPARIGESGGKTSPRELMAAARAASALRSPSQVFSAVFACCAVSVFVPLSTAHGRPSDRSWRQPSSNG